MVFKFLATVLAYWTWKFKQLWSRQNCPGGVIETMQAGKKEGSWPRRELFGLRDLGIRVRSFLAYYWEWSSRCSCQRPYLSGGKCFVSWLDTTCIYLITGTIKMKPYIGIQCLQLIKMELLWLTFKLGDWAFHLLGLDLTLNPTYTSFLLQSLRSWVIRKIAWKILV